MDKNDFLKALEFLMYILIKLYQYIVIFFKLKWIL